MGTVCRYSVGGLSAITAATANSPVGALWNPHATKSITVVDATLGKTTGQTAVYAGRITTRGTPGSTITPDIDNDWQRLIAPISGALLDLAAYSVGPTLAGPDMWRFMASQNVAGNVEEVWLGDGVMIPAGTGLGFFITTAVATTVELSVVWDE